MGSKSFLSDQDFEAIRDRVAARALLRLANDQVVNPLVQVNVAPPQGEQGAPGAPPLTELPPIAPITQAPQAAPPPAVAPPMAVVAPVGLAPPPVQQDPNPASVETGGHPPITPFYSLHAKRREMVDAFYRAVRSIEQIHDRAREWSQENPQSAPREVSETISILKNEIVKSELALAKLMSLYQELQASRATRRAHR